MKKLNKRVCRLCAMVERYHLWTCGDPLAVGEEAIKMANHAATIADTVFDYCRARGLKTQDFYTGSKEGRLLAMGIDFCRDVAKEYAAAEKRGIRWG